ncbi:gephyrin-like molybdotransferase Glp [Allomesorhizobium alhagi]|jgi:molybdopterin molybdotransferase|uniref:Molybdopterin molybdenumtransferase n=1 Tax=Mesorhizobium alhagi CCNWXJ12-2 TaxID=1107882 RepID=H0HRU8_9HYPH|nr:gephyrin-like molybdotransferase Glp [Mesorhizobium alhagi]EHK56536.1 molybdopterin biosynthesis protein MoeA [Mesorhizobium alhagi CCNWXJ12-2]
MAQLSDDCFAFGGPMRSVDETVALIASRLSAVEESEAVLLAIADGRILAKDMVAPLPLPPFTNSAVDGYGLRGDDLPGTAEKAFPVVGRIQAGMAPDQPVAPGQALRIFTGAPLPEGVDTVYMQEDVRVDDAGWVILPPGLKRGANVRPAGEDVAAGKVVLQADQRMRPQDVALAAALGMTQVEVRRKIRVAIFSTGDEIVAPGTVRGPAQLFDSNRFMLMAMLARLGCETTDLGILTDDSGLIADVLSEAASRHDLILASGGVSTGEADYVKAAVESVGTLVFWRVAIKPGRPVAMGVIRGTAFIGLPGNPVASFVTFAHIARAAIFALAGARQQPPVSRPLRAAFSYRKKAGRREYVRVSLRRTEDGTYEAVKFPREGAGLLSSLVETDGLVELGEETIQVEPGQTVQFLAYADLN